MKGELVDDPAVDLIGIPEKNLKGEVMEDVVFDIVVNIVENLPKARKRDPDAMAESVRRAVRSSLADQWGKKTMCYVHILQVED
jgi:ribonuclease J